MSNKRNLYKLDDFSIIISYVFFILFLFQFRFLIEFIKGGSFEEITSMVLTMFQASPIKLGLLLFSAIFFQILGRIVRKKENISLEIIEKLNSGGRYSLDSLAFEMGRSENSLRKILTDLAKIEEAGIAFDGVSIKRVKKQNNDAIAKKFNLDPEARRSRETPPNDDQDHPHQHLRAEQKAPEADLADFHQQQQSEQKPAQQTIFSYSSKKGAAGLPGFNPLIFFVLFFIFWPAAFIYLARIVVKNSQKDAFKKN